MKALAFFLAAASLALPGCKKHEAASAAQAEALHTTTGVIKGLKEGGRILVIDHKEFPGFMEPMVMGFPLKDPEMGRGLKEGDKVEFSIQFTGDAYPIVAVRKLP